VRWIGTGRNGYAKSQSVKDRYTMRNETKMFQDLLRLSKQPLLVVAAYAI
jgi:hypothetical protein